MPLVHTCRNRSSNQYATQRPTRRQPPRSPHCNLVRRSWPAHHPIAPRVDTRLEVAQRLAKLRIQLFQLGWPICLPCEFLPCEFLPCRFVVAFHLFSPSSSRTLPNARERCAFTVPSLNPVASAISFKSRSSTYRSRKTVR